MSEQCTKHPHVTLSNEIVLSLREEGFEGIDISVLKVARDAKQIIQSNLQGVWQQRLETNWKEQAQ